MQGNWGRNQVQVLEMVQKVAKVGSRCKMGRGFQKNQSGPHSYKMKGVITSCAIVLAQLSICSVVRCAKKVAQLSYTLWNPYFLKEIKQIEKVQEVFTRVLYYRCFPCPSYPQSLPPYNERLERLGLHRLDERRFAADLVFARKIMSGESILNRSDYYVYRPTRDRVHTFGINVEFAKNPARFHCFAVRTARAFGRLPIQILQSESIPVFKKRILDFIKGKDLSEFYQ